MKKWGILFAFLWAVAAPVCFAEEEIHCDTLAEEEAAYQEEMFNMVFCVEPGMERTASASTVLSWASPAEIDKYAGWTGPSTYTAPAAAAGMAHVTLILKLRRPEATSEEDGTVTVSVLKNSFVVFKQVRRMAPGGTEFIMGTRGVKVDAGDVFTVRADFDFPVLLYGQEVPDEFMLVRVPQGRIGL
jgi:hypothetical protein